MPIKAELCRDERVLVYTMTDPLTMDEFAPVALSYEKYFKEKLRHILVDAMHLTQLPINILSFFFQETSLPERIQRSDYGYSIIATQSPALRIRASVARHVLPPDKIIIVQSVKEAWAVMDEILAKENSAK
jgi:hypothetical protein